VDVRPEPGDGGRVEERGGPPLQDRLGRLQNPLENRTGEGIPPDFLPYIFNRFEQADASITRRHGGLGLGLAIVKHLVGLHGGGIRAKSDGIGKGATFIVSLPLMAVHSLQGELGREHPQSKPQDRSLLPEISLKGANVLVIDDEPDARNLFKLLLKSAGAFCISGSIGG
jgi:hypothetical protein